MQWIRRGTAWVYGDHIVGDDLIGGPEAVTNDIYAPDVLAKLLMEGVDPDFMARARPGDFIVAGRNFGYSKAHQQVYLALYGFGIGGVVAESFQPFLRRAFPTYGIPFLRCSNLTERVKTGHQLRIDFLAGEITNETKDEVIHCERLPEALVPYYEAGDHLTYLAHKLDRVE